METIGTEIKKVSLKDERLTVEITQEFKLDPEKSDSFYDDINRKCSQVVHKDLKTALDRLKIHLVCICEMSEASWLEDQSIFDFKPDQLSNYEITGYTLGGSDENYGVTIVGKKLLANGQVLNLVAPFTKFEDEDGYKHGGALLADIDGCNYEVTEYLFQGKWGIKQAEFDFDTPNEADLENQNVEAA